MLLISGCRYGIPAEEVGSLRMRTAEWKKIILNSEANLAGLAERHESFVSLVRDTNNFQRRLRLSTDSTLQIQVSQLEQGYAKHLVRHTYNLKMMRIWLTESNCWIERIGSVDLAPNVLRRVWDAKQARFVRLKELSDESAIAFESLSPSYQAIREKVLP